MPVSHKDDKVWFDEPTKLEQICNEVSAFQLSGHSVLLLSHFDATLSQLSALLRARDIDHERFSSLNASELCATAHGKVWMGSARAFRVTSAMTSATAGIPLDIIVAEHQPLESRDKVVIEAAAKLACDGQLCFHFSLDDPVMKHFGSDTIKALYERLDIPKDDCISHHLVTTAIRVAQEKIETQIGKDVPTHSADDWFRYNLRVKAVANPLRKGPVFLWPGRFSMDNHVDVVYKRDMGNDTSRAAISLPLRLSHRAS